jgi:hypothetical protein
MRPLHALRALTIAAVTVGAAAVPSATAHAQTPVPCDTFALINAINTANATPSPLPLSLAPSCVYTLNDFTGPLPSIRSTITIFGNNSTITRDPSASAFRIFRVRSSGVLNLLQVQISNGDAGSGSGGGIRNDGTLTLANSIVTGNTANYSGGIENSPGASAGLASTTVSDNAAHEDGGGIGNSGTMSLEQVTVTDNFGDDYGGGIANDGGLTIADSAITTNLADEHKGGGIANFTYGTVNLFRSAVLGNHAHRAPGGIDNEGFAVTLDASSIVLNNVPTNCSPTFVPGCVG